MLLCIDLSAATGTACPSLYGREWDGARMGRCQAPHLSGPLTRQLTRSWLCPSLCPVPTALALARQTRIGYQCCHRDRD